MLLGPTKTIDLFVGPINGPKTISLGRMKSDSTGHKKARKSLWLRAFRFFLDCFGIKFGGAGGS